MNAKLSIVTLPNPALREVAEPITDFAPGVEKMAAEMLRLIEGIGIGLAANQVGIPVRLIVVAVPGYESLAMCNPVIDWKKGSDVAEEGCLSDPGRKVKVERASKIRVTYQTTKGQIKSFVAADLLARCIQHEVDHLQGVNIVDYVSNHSRALPSGTLPVQPSAQAESQL